MTDDKIVSSIRYSFSLDDLFGETPSRYEIEPSAQRYQALCEESLRAEYPTAERIEVIRADVEGVLPASLDTIVYLWPDFEEDPEEAYVVKEICARIFERRSDWRVSKNLIPISEGDSKAHPCVLRWACTNGLLEGTTKSLGHWEAPAKVLEKFDKSLNTLKADQFIITTQNKRILACFTEDIQDIPIMGLLEQYDQIILYPRAQTEIHFLAPNTCYFLFSKTGATVQISVEHFVDVQSWDMQVQSWSDKKWIYDHYAKALVRQAKRNGISAKFLDSIVFHFNETLEDNPTTQILLKNVFKNLLVTVGETEISLSGGPIWDKTNDEIYKEDEDRFCKEILEPLLKKMDFINVRYTHGIDEFGRDFFFEYSTPFFEPIYFALQAKRGKASGGANSEIDKILGQIEDAFSMPFTGDPAKSKAEQYIGCMIIAIGGEFAPNAVTKIRYKMPKSLVGSVYFWDKPKILSLISHYWGRSR